MDTKVVLQINTCNNAYSTGKIASDIGETAIKRGWTSFIASSKADAYCSSNNTPIFIGGKIDHYFHALETRLFDNPGLGISSRIATRKLIKTIEQIKPDIIHLHIIHGYYLNIEILFNYLSRIETPIVWTIHSCWEFTGHCGFFTSVGCRKWKNHCHHCPIIKNYPKSWFRDRSSKNFDEKKRLFNSVKNMTLIPVSKWLGSMLEESFLNKYLIYPIYNGIDTSLFKPSTNRTEIRKKLGVSDKFFVIGVATTWEKRKNIEDYYRLSQILPDDYIIGLVGLNEKQKKQIPRKIIGMPKTSSQQELVDLYSAADIVLNLSLEETFGLTTVEGFACGTPSIVYNCTASPELISDETGFVVEAGDIDSVFQCMKIIKERGRDKYVENCRKRSEQYFDKDKNFQDYINLYERLLNNNRK